jgi:DNA polymerase I-like protein with 3'-5' exonuclease and polymerase domains
VNPEDNDLPFESVDEIPKQERPADTKAASNGAPRDRNPSQATLLVDLVGDIELFHTPGGKAYATVDVGGHEETWAVQGHELSKWLRRLFFETHKKAPSDQALKEALGVIDARAQFDGREEAVHVRVAGRDDAVYLDLGDPAWRTVEITPQGWGVVSDPPVKFRRPRGAQPLPMPAPGGHISALRRFVNVDGDDAFHLLVAWLVGAMRPTGPYPILALQGEQASAKSTTARVLRRLVDPSTAPLRRAPRNERDLMISAQNAWLLSYDNLSGLPPTLSDTFCSLSTGGGLSTRELYSDDGEIIFHATRPIILNGIDTIATRADLADRAVDLTLPHIAETQRQDEASFWSAFNAVAPLILGSLFDAVSAALRNLGRVTLSRRPRMADFALWVTAAEAAFGWAPETFLQAYDKNRAQAVDVSLDTDPVASAVQALLERAPGGTWEGSATELQAELQKVVPEPTLRSRAWPRWPNALTNRLRRAAPTLRAVGILHEDLPRSGRAGARRLRLRRSTPRTTVSTVSTVSADSADSATDDEPPAQETADEHAPAAGSERKVDRQMLAVGQPSQAGSADGADGPLGGVFNARYHEPLIHRDASGLPTLAEAIVAAGRVGFGVVATGPNALLHFPQAVGIALPEGEVHVIDLCLMGPLDRVWQALDEVLVVGHDLKPALAHLAHNFGWGPARLFDTMIAVTLLDGGLDLGNDEFFSLTHVCERLLKVKLPPVEKREAFRGPVPEATAINLSQRLGPLLDLHEALQGHLQEDGLTTAAALENALLPVVVSMELTGVPVDRARLEKVVAAWTEEAGVLHENLRRTLNVRSADNGNEVLAALRRLGVSIDGTKAENLAPYAHLPEVGHLVRYRHIQSFAASTGKRVLQQLGERRATRVYPVLDQLGSASGRFSCRLPNLMGMPREPEVRACIRAEPGKKLVVADYATIELRTLADQINEPQLTAMFLAGGDPHRATASLVMGVPEEQVTDEQRRQAKAINFGFIFGMGPESFVGYARKNYGVELSVEQAAAFKSKFLAAYPGVAEWQSKMQTEMPDVVRSASGRLRYFPDQNQDYGARLSHAVQGSAADGMKQAMVRLFNDARFRQIGAQILLVVHDELLVEVPEEHADEARDIVESCMIEGMAAFVKSVPLVVEAAVRTSWAKGERP